MCGPRITPFEMRQILTDSIEVDYPDAVWHGEIERPLTITVEAYRAATAVQPDLADITVGDRRENGGTHVGKSSPGRKPVPVPGV